MSEAYVDRVQWSKGGKVTVFGCFPCEGSGAGWYTVRVVQVIDYGLLKKDEKTRRQWFVSLGVAWLPVALAWELHTALQAAYQEYLRSRPPDVTVEAAVGVNLGALREFLLAHYDRATQTFDLEGLNQPARVRQRLLQFFGLELPELAELPEDAADIWHRLWDYEDRTDWRAAPPPTIWTALGPNWFSFSAKQQLLEDRLLGLPIISLQLHRRIKEVLRKLTHERITTYYRYQNDYPITFGELRELMLEHLDEKTGTLNVLKDTPDSRFLVDFFGLRLPDLPAGAEASA